MIIRCNSLSLSEPTLRVARAPKPAAATRSGFHGLQAVPLVALILGWARVPVEAARRWVHVAGITWLGTCAAIAWQTARGQSVLEISAATLLAFGLLAGWLVCAVMASVAWRRAGVVRSPA